MNRTYLFFGAMITGFAVEWFMVGNFESYAVLIATRHHAITAPLSLTVLAICTLFMQLMIHSQNYPDMPFRSAICVAILTIVWLMTVRHLILVTRWAVAISLMSRIVDAILVAFLLDMAFVIGSACLIKFAIENRTT